MARISVRLRSRSLRTVLVVAALVSVCTSETSAPSVPVASVVVSPPAAPLPVRTTIQLTVALKDSAGGQLTGRVITWASSDSAVAAVNGSGVVTGVSLGQVTITATSEGKRGTAAITVTPGHVVRLVFTSQPTAAIAGALISPPIRVAALDELGDTATGFTGNITISPGANPGSAALAGTTTVGAVNGVAAFANLRLDKAGTGYTLVAAATAVSPDTSTAFDITPGSAGPAVQLAFTIQPTSTGAGAVITPAVEVTALDSLGIVTTGFTGNVTISLGGNPGGATLSGTTTVVGVGGVATFTDLSLDRAGAGYTLVAVAAALAPDTSTAFEVTSGPATQLAFTTQPSATGAGDSITPAVAVAALDNAGNTATGFTGNVTITLGGNPESGTLSGTTTVAAVGGVATFANLSLDRAGTGYSLVASAPGFLSAASTSFEVSAGPATQLEFRTQPTTTGVGEVITPAVAVTPMDNLGNAATGFTGDVTVTLGTNPGGATLLGTTTAPAVSGVAAFADLRLDKPGVGYTLVATAAGELAATSTAFEVAAGSGTQLAFTSQPTTTGAGETINPAVTVLDSLGNTATGFTGSVTIALGDNPGSATLSGTTTTAAVAGVATFTDLSLDKAGTGYTLLATAASVSPATSTAFDITAGLATQLDFTTQPTATSAGSPVTPAVVVTARDALGNTATSFTGNVTIALGTNPGGAALAGTTVATAVGGVVSFADLLLDRAGTGYTLVVTATGLTAATSTAFDVAAAAAARLVFTTQPTNSTAGSPITPAVVVTAEDSLGNTVTSFGGNVTITLGSNPGGATLSGTNLEAAVNGVATFANLHLDKAGAGYTLVATAPALTGASSGSFNVTAAGATVLGFTIQPSTTVAGAAISPAVQVTARDGFGNTAASFTGNVTIVVGNNPGGDTIAGTQTVAAAAGIATFADLTLDRAGTGYTLVAEAASLTSATSASFSITSASETTLAFTVQPSSAVAGAAITPAVQVTARDNFGNPATSFAGNVTIALQNNPGGATLSGTKTRPAVAGVASFTNLTLDKVGSGYTLAASAASLTGATSASFTITSANATRLAFTAQPTSTVVGTAITPAVQVTARDNFGNTATGFTGNVTITLGNNPGGASLGGTKTRAAVAGVATFNNLTLSKVGSGYTLRASASGLSGATSSAFNVTATGSTVVLVGAGDIADCGTSGDEATADLLDGIAGTVFTAGDNAYNNGSATDFAQCYEPTWGRHKARTRPSPGNHDYRTADASGYFAYYGSNAGPPSLGYYSYDLGNWHIISLNSNISMSAGSTQEQWLRADLAASSKPCTLAYWHHPRFSSGSHHGSSTESQPLWQALYDDGSEIVISGHEHNYERFAPQTPTGTADATGGIREFVVGTGGTDFYPSGTPIGNSEVRSTGVWGVLKLTLSSNAYTWQFVPVAGQSFTDSGTTSCH